MLPWQENAQNRARDFSTRRPSRIMRVLGGGYDGLVFATDQNTAIKSFKFEQLYARERDVYLRLLKLNMHEVHGCRVPRLVDFADPPWCIEMEIVQPPFVLDFAGAALDARPEFPADIQEEWLAEKLEQYGDDWPLVRSIIASFAGMGIYLGDVKPGNVTLH